jgi:nucleoside 2-deoxyribosyltransferase
MVKVYWAASLHSEDARAANERYARMLEEQGYEVLLPQRHGVWEVMVQEEMRMYPAMPREAAVNAVKARCYEADMRDLLHSDACILYCPEVPSEGAVFEYGYCFARKACCILFCPDDEVYKEINLMVTESSVRCKMISDVFDLLPDSGSPF